MTSVDVEGWCGMHGVFLGAQQSIKYQLRSIHGVSVLSHVGRLSGITPGTENPDDGH